MIHIADRSITARLRLVTSEYNKGLQDAANKTRQLGGDADKAAKRSSDSWMRLGRATADLGDRMTTSLTVPILALGGMAVKMANDFGNIFTQMEATAGVAGSEVAGLKDRVLDLAGATGQAPKELAEALLLIRSSGFSGAEAMDVLQTSAEGAAAGMGTTREIANALTNVISGYGAANIDAAEAMDILTASVTEGKAEAAEMAPQFGRLVPIAAELGVEFSELGGIMAFLTKPTGDAALSATQLSGVLAKMLEPGVEGAEALKAVGMSAEDLRASIREKGLHQTLLDLRKNLEDNGLKLNDFAVDQQFLQGALLLTGASAEDAAQIIENVGDSAGAADEAFKKWGESLGAKNSKAWAEAQAAMIRFGDLALPMVATVAEHIGNLIKIFADLPKGVQEAILVFALLVAAIGPIASTVGRVADGWQILSKVVGGSASNFASATLGAGLLATALGAVMLALNAAIQKRGETEKRIKSFADALEEGGRKARVAADDLLATELAAGGLGQQLTDSGADMGLFIEDMREGAEQAKELQDQLQSTAGRGSTEWKKALDDAADSGNKFAESIREIVEAEDLSREETINLLERMNDLSGDYAEGAEQAKANATAQEAVAESAGEVGLAIDEQGNIVDAAAQKIEELTSALDELLGRFLAVPESVRRQNELVLGLGEHFKKMREEFGGNALALDGVTAAGIRNSDMFDSLFDATAATTQAMIDNGATSEAIALQWASDRAELQALRDKFAEAGQDVSRYDQLLAEIDELVRTQVTQPGMPGAQAAASTYGGTVRGIPNYKTTRVETRGLTQSQIAVSNFKAQLDALPWSKTVNVNVVLNDPTGGKLAALAGRRAAGGPVHKDRLYEVGEGGAHELLQADGRSYLIPGSNGTVIPAGPMTSAASLGGGGGDTLVFNFPNLIHPDSRKFRQMVVKAVNVAGRKTQGLNAA